MSKPQRTAVRVANTRHVVLCRLTAQGGTGEGTAQGDTPNAPTKALSLELKDWPHRQVLVRKAKAWQRANAYQAFCATKPPSGRSPVASLSYRERIDDVVSTRS